MSTITVAIAGATGTAGRAFVKGFLALNQISPSHNVKVIAFSRSASSPELSALGVQVESRPWSIETLAGVDVVVNALGALVPWDTHNSLAEAAAKAGVKVYFAPDYGIDYYTHKEELPTNIFDGKIDHSKYARSIGGGMMKVFDLMSGPFMEWAMRGRGLDTEKGVFTCPGSVDTRLSFTSLRDIGLSAASLSLLAIKDADSVPDVVRLSGDAKSWREMAQLVETKTGQHIQLVSLDKEEFRKSLGPTDFMNHIRLCFATGLFDKSEDNHNELVNPGEKYWKWKTLKDFVEESNGTLTL